MHSVSLRTRVGGCPHDKDGKYCLAWADSQLRRPRNTTSSLEERFLLCLDVMGCIITAERLSEQGIFQGIKWLGWFILPPLKTFAYLPVLGEAYEGMTEFAISNAFKLKSVFHSVAKMSQPEESTNYKLGNYKLDPNPQSSNTSCPISDNNIPFTDRVSVADQAEGRYLVEG